MRQMQTVLVVDDEEIVRDVVVRYLERDGFETLVAADGDAARALDLDVGDRLGFADAVAVVALSESDMPPERALQMDPPEELLDQSHAAELNQADSIGGNAKISGSTAHCCRTALLMKVCNRSQNSYFRGSQQAFLKLSWCP